jgi:signal transduction histidine kinase
MLRELTRGFDRRRIVLTCVVAMATAGLLCVPGMTLAPFPDFLMGSSAYAFAIAWAVTVASNLRQRWVPVLVWNAAAVVVASLVVSLLLYALKRGNPPSGDAFDGQQVMGSLVTLGLVIGAVMGFVMLLFERQSVEQAQHEARERLLEKQVLQAQLKTLQAQVEPHFLFNTLASVQRLVATNPPAASLMLDDLNQYLRASLPDMRETHSTVGREVAMARAYLNIMQVRMGQRLRYRIELPASISEQPFPPMMLLSLVENAVEHGVGDGDDGLVVVRAKMDTAGVALSVSDNGAGFDAKAPAGVGLSNIRDRLAALYGQDATLTLDEPATVASGDGLGGASSGVTACIRIPHDVSTPT